ncbi:MAG: hypothetical protein E2P02_27890 [Acidobacteria bacterium]|nr:MAG: hypothetical protein E2P02_27890 [Acidobacteriota bacterium]
MKSFQEDFYLDASHPLRRLSRNVRLIGYILQVAFLWLVEGGRVRRAVLRARETREPFEIDHLGD